MAAVGKIVEVQGGRIVRATGRKDRHSKVFTSRGLRDRRVRLSANTAIQFYDVQDRLGYDRPSEAVDWLMEKARSSIDKLTKLPADNNADLTTLTHHHHHQQQQADNVQETSLRDLHHLFHNTPISTNLTSNFMDDSGFDQIDDCSQELRYRMSSKRRHLCLDSESLLHRGAENSLLLASPSHTFWPEQLQKPEFGQSPYSRNTGFDLSSIQVAVHPQCSIFDGEHQQNGNPQFMGAEI